MGVPDSARAQTKAVGPDAADQDAHDRGRPLYDRQGLLREDRQVRHGHGHLGRRESR